MENNEIYKKLNSRTRKYITEAFSWIDFLSNNDFELKMNGNEGEVFTNKIVDKVDIVTSGFFLASLSMNGPVKNIFNSHGIDIGTFTGFCKDAKRSLIKQKDATLTEAFDEVDIEHIIKTIVDEIKYDNDMGDIEFDISDIEPRHLFDYFIHTYYEVISDIIESEIGDNDENEIYEDAIEEYDQYYIQEEKELMAKYGIDLKTSSAEDSEEEAAEYTFGNITLLYDDGDVIINLAPCVIETTVPTISENAEQSEVRILTGTHIYKINGKKATKSTLDEFVKSFKNSSVCNFTIWDAQKGDVVEFSAYKDDLFYSGLNKEDDEKANEEIERNISFVKEGSEKYSLASLGTDITQKKFIKNPAIGRKKELDNLEISLLYKERDMSICITGDAGVGKTALVEGLCYRIQNGTVSDALKDLRIIKIDVSSLVAGTKYVGTLEKKMESILREASKDKNIVLFIDEIHRAMGAGKTEGDNNTVAEMLKQYLDRGDVRVIGATTTEEYAEYVEPNTAFKTRFDVIQLKEPDDEAIFDILNDLIDSYNKLGSPVISLSKEKRDDLIRMLISATRRTFRDYKDRANNPRLIINIIKRAYAIADFQKSKEVTIEHLLQSYNSCERLYKDSRERQSKIIRSSFETEKPSEPRGMILEFKPRDKKE